jgi:hypothetical protein
MSDGVTRDQIKQARAVLDEIREEMIKSKSPSALNAMAIRMQKAAGRLEGLAIAYEAQEAAKLPEEARRVPARIKVKLTEGQRALVVRDVGIDLEEVELIDSGARYVHSIPTAKPIQLNAAILRAARRVKAQRAAQAEVRRLMAQLESVDDPVLRQQLEVARKNPNFLGGLLND